MINRCGMARATNGSRVIWWVIVTLLSFGIMSAATSGEAGRNYQNPVVPGFHPDPSICRAGQDYYLVHSSFEFFPGVPIFHSKDLVHWQQIGYVLNRKSQLSLAHMRASGGIYAPTLRYHKGTFYMVTTLVGGGGNFYVTAKNPAGPWSDPIWLDQGGIDPSVLFDDDGTTYYTRHEGMADGSIVQSKLNLESGKLEGGLKEIWKGTGGAWPEGPHLYKMKGRYFLMIAEGGTGYGHMETIARSDSPWGPFEADPHNPILTHRNRPDHPIQALGHADMVETPNGWWMVSLGIRPQGGRFHHLGRETFLEPVEWTKDDWPIVNENGSIELSMAAPRMPEHTWKSDPAEDEFNGTQLGLQWNFLRNPYEEDYSLTERPGFLRLKGSAVSMSDQDSPAFVGRRQEDLNCRLSTKLSFKPQHENEEAGIVVRGNDANHYEIGITLKQGVRQVFFRKILGGKISEPVRNEKIAPGDVVLSVEASPLVYKFFYEQAQESPKELGQARTRDLSSETIGGFTGVYFGMFATGNGQKSSTTADFDWFEYHPGKP